MFVVFLLWSELEYALCVAGFSSSKSWKSGLVNQLWQIMLKRLAVIWELYLLTRTCAPDVVCIQNMFRIFLSTVSSRGVFGFGSWNEKMFESKFLSVDCICSLILHRVSIWLKVADVSFYHSRLNLLLSPETIKC